MAKSDTALADRLMKAAALVLGDKVSLGSEPGSLEVESLTTGSRYVVADGQCSCPDAAKHPERACKHRLSVEMFRRLTA